MPGERASLLNSIGFAWKVTTRPTTIHTGARVEVSNDLTTGADSADEFRAAAARLRDLARSTSAAYSYADDSLSESTYFLVQFSECSSVAYRLK